MYWIKNQAMKKIYRPKSQRFFLLVDLENAGFCLCSFTIFIPYMCKGTLSITFSKIQFSPKISSNNIPKFITDQYSS